ncbi:MAG: TIGR01440 family protein [Lachnospiraceae bacterium]|nr:TIGR01440 family protein [Lachnospiraceae bacterium]
MYEEIKEEGYQAAKELCEKAALKKGQILVIGCSTSEVCGSRIGSNSNYDVAEALFAGIYQAAEEAGVFLAAQCCEHLNRAIIAEQDAVPFAEYVNVIPQPKAGGSFATAAYQKFKHPVAIEEIKADAGIDIGDIFIGMHLKKVAVPTRLEHNHIGEAHVTAARTRPKFIGGERAHYNTELL